MQKVKRKNQEGDSSTPKKKKPNHTRTENEKSGFDDVKKKKFVPNSQKNNNGGIKGDKITKFDGGKGGKKFGKPVGKGKPNAVKDQGDGEKPNWSEMKKEKKQLRIVRRKAKATAEVFEISHKAKLLAAQIQRKTIDNDFRMNACQELHGLLKGQYKSMALTHDLSRVIQVLLKHSPEGIRNEIAKELLDIIVQMAQSKYAQHALKRILKYGTNAIRHEVIKKFMGHIVSLATHSISAPVLDYVYSTFAMKVEKYHMQQEFYGEIYKNTKDDTVKSLNDAYKDCPEMKPAILQACKANIQRILDKNLHDGELFHQVLYYYINECSMEERTELISTLSPLIVPLSNSMPGAKVACKCIWQGTNKDKKTILKVVKEHVLPLSKHKTGYQLLLAIFDSVDDTVLVKKVIVSTLVENLKDVANDHWGNMTLHWLVKPRDPPAFHPKTVNFLEEGAKSGTSKKDAELRVTELREAILPAMKNDFVSDAEFWLSTKTSMLLAVTVISIESSKEVLDAFAKVICRPDWRMKGSDKLAVEDPAMHSYLKKLAGWDKGKTDGTFAESIAQHLDDDVIKTWLPTNRGCFFLLKLIESNDESTAKKLRKKLKPYIALLNEQTSTGAKLLLQKVQKI